MIATGIMFVLVSLLPVNLSSVQFALPWTVRKSIQ